MQGPEALKSFPSSLALVPQMTRDFSPQESYYQPRTLEKHADSILALASVLWSISYYTSPLAMFYLYRKGYLTMSKVVPFSHYVGTLLLLLAGVACLRGIGRWTNPQYIQFITILENSHRLGTPEIKVKGAGDPDPSLWPLLQGGCPPRSPAAWPAPKMPCSMLLPVLPPKVFGDGRGGEAALSVFPTMLCFCPCVSHDAQGPGAVVSPMMLLLLPPPHHGAISQNALHLPWCLTAAFPLHTRCPAYPPLSAPPSYVVAHTFGRRMLYPGSVYLLQKAVMPMLLQGQARLVEEYNGKRAKLLACDGNEIDTMFMDRRQSSEPRGKKLVICCEGNAGFYEVGCLPTPLDAGYSVLGWNHPGFAGSTVIPVPLPELGEPRRPGSQPPAAMDVVLQYAIHRLGFLPEDIVVYAWSIGGFAGTRLRGREPVGLGREAVGVGGEVELPAALFVHSPPSRCPHGSALFSIPPSAYMVWPFFLNPPRFPSLPTWFVPDTWTSPRTHQPISYHSPPPSCDSNQPINTAQPPPLVPHVLEPPMLHDCFHVLLPRVLGGLVTRTVRQHLNLNNGEQLCRYQGPILLVRRTKDEIITTTVPEDIMSNRGNDLLLKLLQHRYPKVMGEEGVRVVREWLEASSAVEEGKCSAHCSLEEDWCLSVLKSYQAEHGDRFPWSLGDDMTPEGRRQLALFLVSAPDVPLPGPELSGWKITLTLPSVSILQGSGRY
nr:protein ABHD16A-like [Pelodiscus sinensis]|eukprot:XP_025039315.1 protein ABHD16A-like [Pelodiscus sinensis]